MSGSELTGPSSPTKFKRGDSVEVSAGTDGKGWRAGVVLDVVPGKLGEAPAYMVRFLSKNGGIIIGLRFESEVRSASSEVKVAE